MNSHNTFLSILASLLVGCSSTMPIPTVDEVELPRFMGKWYVIANIPTFIEKGAHNATETYVLNTDGSIATHFQFNQDGFDGKLKNYYPTGRVVSEDNASWEMQFIWPFWSNYRVIYLDDDYQVTVIGRDKRDYVWVMSRTPVISPDHYQGVVQKIAQLGYDISKLQRVPQQPEDRK